MNATPVVPLRGTARPKRSHYLRQHSLALAVIAGLLLIALPPVFVTPSGPVEISATAVLTVFAGVLVTVICFASLRR